MIETHYEVAGMTCDHCVAAVTGELTSLDGVSSVDVVLLDGGISVVTVQSAAPLRHGVVRDAIAEAGYELVS